MQAYNQQRHVQRREAAAQSMSTDDVHVTSKCARAPVLVDFLFSTFGATALAAGTGVIDVAGGRGDVAFELYASPQRR